MALTRDEIDQRMSRFAAVLRQTGSKTTHQRMEIFREVARTTAHPNAETVLKRVRERMPTVSMDTVYRTLAFLEEAGLISRVSALHGSARFDANALVHPHFVCTECGIVRDISTDELAVAVELPSADEWGEVTSIHAEARGVCSECLRGHEKRRGA